MKATITYSFLLALTLAAIAFGCSKITIIDMKEEPEQEVYIPKKVHKDTEDTDTSRVPISFDVSVDNWGDEEKNIY